LPDMNKLRKCAMRLQEFILDCLGNADFAVEAREHFNSADLEERRDCGRVTDNNHLDDRRRNWLMSSNASCSV